MFYILNIITFVCKVFNLGGKKVSPDHMEHHPPIGYLHRSCDIRHRLWRADDGTVLESFGIVRLDPSSWLAAESAEN